MKLTESKLRSIIREELSKLNEMTVDGPFQKRELAYYDPDGFYERSGYAVVLRDRTVAAGADVTIATIRGMKKYDDHRKYEQETTFDDLEETGVRLTVDELEQLKRQGTVPERIEKEI